MQNSLLYSAKFLICLYTSILPPLLPLFMNNLKLSLALTGSLMAIFSLFTSFIQPVFGWLSDKKGYYPFIKWTPLWVGIFIGLLGLCGSYYLVVFFLSLAGIGIAAFHPAGFSYAGGLPSQHNGHTISMLMLYGTLGFVAGPFAVSLFVDYVGIGRSWFLIFPGVVITSALLCSSAGQKELLLKKSDSSFFVFFRSLHTSFHAIKPLFIFATGITIIAMNLYCFAPIVWSAEGYSVVVVGMFLSIFSLGCAFGPIIGSWAAKKAGEKKVMLFSTLSSSVLLPSFVHVHAMSIKGSLFFPLGLSLMLPYAIIIHLGQQNDSEHRGLVSSLLGGVAWGLGGLALLFTGPLSDSFGIDSVLHSLVLFLFINLVLVCYCKSFRGK